MEDERGWKNVEVIPIRKTGKWVSGVVLQENSEGKRRIKLFKGIIKEKGSLEVEWKGEKIKVSMIQRFNITSKRYWEEVKKTVEKVISEIKEKEETEGQEKLERFV